MWIVVIENIYLRREELISPNQYFGDFIDKHVVLCPAALLDNVYSEWFDKDLGVWIFWSFDNDELFSELNLDKDFV